MRKVLLIYLFCYCSTHLYGAAPLQFFGSALQKDITTEEERKKLKNINIHISCTTHSLMAILRYIGFNWAPHLILYYLHFIDIFASIAMIYFIYKVIYKANSANRKTSNSPEWAKAQLRAAKQFIIILACYSLPFFVPAIAGFILLFFLICSHIHSYIQKELNIKCSVYPILIVVLFYLIHVLNLHWIINSIILCVSIFLYNEHCIPFDCSKLLFPIYGICLYHNLEILFAFYILCKLQSFIYLYKFLNPTE